MAKQRSRGVARQEFLVGAHCAVQGQRASASFSIWRPSILVFAVPGLSTLAHLFLFWHRCCCSPIKQTIRTSAVPLLGAAALIDARCTSTEINGLKKSVYWNYGQGTGFKNDHY